MTPSEEMLKSSAILRLSSAVAALNVTPASLMLALLPPRVMRELPLPRTSRIWDVARGASVSGRSYRRDRRQPARRREDSGGIIGWILNVALDDGYVQARGVALPGSPDEFRIACHVILHRLFHSSHHKEDAPGGQKVRKPYGRPPKAQ